MDGHGCGETLHTPTEFAQGRHEVSPLPIESGVCHVARHIYKSATKGRFTYPLP
jgi:hypothetical protein